MIARYSKTVAETRTELSGYYQVPLLPTYWEIVASSFHAGQPA